MGSSADYARHWYAQNRDKLREQRRYKRRNNVALSIYQDARKADRKKQRTNDLTLELVKRLIASPCSYCGDNELRKTLDRVDNSLGHVESNVVVACERCNYVRRDMPYDAWLVVANGMRAAREAGMFGHWNGGIHRRYSVEPVVIDNGKRCGPVPHGTLAGYHRCGPPTCAPCRAAMARWKRERRNIARSRF
jgi:hypothetical protein